jgi:hypothetical protein
MTPVQLQTSENRKQAWAASRASNSIKPDLSALQIVSAEEFLNLSAPWANEQMQQFDSSFSTMDHKSDSQQAARFAQTELVNEGNKLAVSDINNLPVAIANTQLDRLHEFQNATTIRNSIVDPLLLCNDLTENFASSIANADSEFSQR